MAEAVIPPHFSALLNRFDTRQKVGMSIAFAMFVALLVGVWLWSKEPPYSVLFSNLAEKDGGQIVTVLQQQNVPYKYSENGGAILVPASMVHDVRLKLASQGLPRGGMVGFELMENLKLGTTQFAEQIAFQRGLEGELSRTVQSLAAVRGARVHLAIPKQTAFLRDEKPSASVLVSLHPGRILEPMQIAGIVHLVASSVPQLATSQVSVVDQEGNLLSQQPDALRNAGLDPSQIKLVREMEASFVKRIESILAPVVGTGNMRAQVSADVDFSHIEQVAETYRPNPNPDTAVRSQQTAETGNPNPQAVGVPGALTNQPPVPATAPITTPPVAGGTTAGTGGAASNIYSRNATINYEVDKTVRHTKGVPGTLRRLSVAVVVNYKKSFDKNGKPGKPVPLADEEIKQINALVRDAVGFSQDRNDSINVANVSFVPVEKEAVPDSPIWKNPDAVAMGRELFKYLVMAAVALLLWVKLFKPIFEMFAAAARRVEAEEAAKAEEAARAEEEAAAAGDHHHHHTGPSFEEKIAQARELTKQDPKAVAGLIKDWMGSAQPT